MEEGIQTPMAQGRSTKTSRRCGGFGPVACQQRIISLGVWCLGRRFWVWRCGMQTQQVKLITGSQLDKSGKPQTLNPTEGPLVYPEWQRDNHKVELPALRGHPRVAAPRWGLCRGCISAVIYCQTTAHATMRTCCNAPRPPPYRRSPQGPVSGTTPKSKKGSPKVKFPAGSGFQKWKQAQVPVLNEGPTLWRGVSGMHQRCIFCQTTASASPRKALRGGISKVNFE